MTNSTETVQLRVSGEWELISIPLDVECCVETLSFANAIRIPECCHLQPTLYPNQPYWGCHLRDINTHAWVYKRVFTPPQVDFQRAQLRFDGVDYFASVWLNGTWVGEHEGNFAPFTIDVTKDCHPYGENVLVVRVTSPWDKRTPNGIYPMDHVLRGLVKGNYEHGEGVIPPDVNPIGIWQPVWLILDQGISIDSLTIRADMDGSVAVSLMASNALQTPFTGKLRLQIEPENHDGLGITSVLPVVLTDKLTTIDTELTISEPRLWWPWDHGAPNLYRLTVQIIDDKGNCCSNLSDTFGVRRVRLERSPERFTFFVNERPVFLRGTSYMPALYLSQCSPEIVQQDLAYVRDLNLNLLRVHVHVSPRYVYDLCDRAGILIWQDFELNWVQDPSLAFEARARQLQKEMIALLGNHPSIVAWACHNEPTMIFSRRVNLEKHPDPMLYADALTQDPTRPVFICSGQAEQDWQRSGDAHSYYGAIWSQRYTDIYPHTYRLNTEFGFEAPSASTTLRQYPECWERLQHLEPQINELWEYQAELISFHVDHFRRQRMQSCAGYIHFWLVDLVPQVGCGVLDANRQKKGGYLALKTASEPFRVAMEHDGRRPYAIWIFNDTPESYGDVVLNIRIYDGQNRLSYKRLLPLEVAANLSAQITKIQDWPASTDCCMIELELHDASGVVLTTTQYEHPFDPKLRPIGYPWKFDPFLGCKVFNRCDAPSLADLAGNSVVKLVPLFIRERIAEWVLRQRLPPWLLTTLDSFVDSGSRSDSQQ